VGGIHPALIEAMAAGRPVLYLDTDSNRETAGVQGVIFSKDEADLAAKIQRLIDAPAERTRLGSAAAEFARQRYSWDEITRQYLELFYQLKPQAAISAASSRSGR